MQQTLGSHPSQSFYLKHTCHKKKEKEKAEVDVFILTDGKLVLPIPSSHPLSHIYFKG